MSDSTPYVEDGYNVRFYISAECAYITRYSSRAVEQRKSVVSMAGTVSRKCPVFKPRHPDTGGFNAWVYNAFGSWNSIEQVCSTMWVQANRRHL